MEQQNSMTSRKLIRAAQYVRVLTGHHQYSTENQSEAIAHYAERNGMEIVATNADSGKSGLTLAGRDELQKLLAKAESAHEDFSELQVYDVTLWGRFQDVDEAPTTKTQATLVSRDKPRRHNRDRIREREVEVQHPRALRKRRECISSSARPVSSSTCSSGSVIRHIHPSLFAISSIHEKPKCWSSVCLGW